MRFIAVFFIIMMNFIIQSTLLQHFRVFNVLPNTTLIIVVVFSILWGRNRGAVIGLFSGLIQDILFGSMIGTNALIYMLIGLYIGSLENSIFKDNNLTPIFFSTLGTLSYHFLYYLVMYVTRNEESILLLLKRIVAVECIYNAILSVFIYKIVYHLSKHPNFRLRVR